PCSREVHVCPRPVDGSHASPEPRGNGCCRASPHERVADNVAVPRIERQEPSRQFLGKWSWVCRIMDARETPQSPWPAHLQPCFVIEVVLRLTGAIPFPRATMHNDDRFHWRCDMWRR